MTKELNKLRSTALAWLGRQEYYEAKFRQKLLQNEATPEQIELLVQEFTERNWLCEQRYCDGFVRGRVNKGHGKIRIRADARQKGLDQDCLNIALDANETDWFDQAWQTYSKRYGDRLIADHKERAKRMRFMQYRGFTIEQINHAIEQSLPE
jgi:regulatory protein